MEEGWRNPALSLFMRKLIKRAYRRVKLTPIKGDTFWEPWEINGEVIYLPKKCGGKKGKKK